MKNIISKIVILLSVISMIFACASCGGSPESTESSSDIGEIHDYVSELKLDMSSDTLKQQVTVKTYVDGDTTHFFAPESFIAGGVLKARYLAINTPESTGKIEEYGKTAANFTKEKLSGATSIIVESDDGNLNRDSTGSRYLFWVWYRTSEDEDYRNLNLEILQNGLALASSTANNRYGDICVKALNQARAQKLAVYSGENDPNFFYGEAVELTLRELRPNIADYVGVKVAFEGVVTRGYDGSIYVEEYDPESGLYFGISVYCGFSLSGGGLSILQMGNRVRIVGTVEYWESGQSYQVSGISYRAMKPDDPNNIQKLGEGYSAAYVPTGADTLMNGKVTLETEEGEKTFEYNYLTMNTTLFMENLKVVYIETTDDENSDSYGAMTLYCKDENGVSVQVRTSPLYDADGSLITSERYSGKNISVRGVIDTFAGECQIKLFSTSDITINE